MNDRRWCVGDAIRWTPDPLVVAYGPVLEPSADRCPSLRGTIVEIDYHGEPCRMKVAAVEGDWSLNTRWWQGRPIPGDIFIMEPTTKSGVIEALDAAEIGSVTELLAAVGQSDIIGDDPDKCLDCGAQLVPCTCSPRCPGGECSACRGRDLEKIRSEPSCNDERGHQFCDAEGNRVYSTCQRECGTHDPDDEADKKTREQAMRVRLRLAHLDCSVEAIAGLIDDVESGLAACLASPVIFGGQAQRDGAIAAARAQLAKPAARGSIAVEIADGDHLARIILDLLGEPIGNGGR